ncbi:gigaxonin-like [Panicum miliaceum]|uniref:Gigaxonin-like n=1 Tax=Panicum miliaceum TaxID=4540 RepID=A0A3L6T2X2_PANMI|nr:gigaxonin-like [Panicum miliaceum]
MKPLLPPLRSDPALQGAPSCLAAPHLRRTIRRTAAVQPRHRSTNLPIGPTSSAHSLDRGRGSRGWKLVGASSKSSYGPPFPNLRAWVERGERGGSILGTPDMGEGVEGGSPRAAIAAAVGARGELCSGRETEGCGMGKASQPPSGRASAARRPPARASTALSRAATVRRGALPRTQQPPGAGLRGGGGGGGGRGCRGPVQEELDPAIGKGVLECAVCLMAFENDDNLRLLPHCSHAFHSECFNPCLQSRVQMVVAQRKPSAPPEAVAIPVLDDGSGAEDNDKDVWKEEAIELEMLRSCAGGQLDRALALRGGSHGRRAHMSGTGAGSRRAWNLAMQTYNQNSKYGELTRNLRETQLGGVIFGCKYDTIDECFKKQLFVHYSYVRNVKPGMPLFLFNYSDRKLHGIFEAASPGQMYIDPYAWSNDGSLRTTFPAQVRICTKTQYPPLLESQFKTLLGDNYYNHHHFYFELDHAQTRALISLFKSLAPANLNQVPAVSRKRNLAISPSPTKMKLPAVPDPKKVTENPKETNPFSVLSNRASPFNWADVVDSASNTDEKKSEDLLSDCDDLDDNLPQDQSVPHSNPDEVSQNFSDKTVDQGVELVKCNHPVANPVNGERVTIDEPMLLNPLDDQNGAVDVDEIESEVHNIPGGVGLQPERQTILEKLKELSFQRQQVAVSSQDCVDSSSDQCVPDETQINANLSCDPFDAAMEDKTSSDDCHGNDELLQIITVLSKRTEALEKKLIGSDQEILSLREVVKDSGRKVQQLQYLVDELQFKFDSSLSHLGSMCNTLAKPSIFLIGGYNGVTWLSSLESFSPEKETLVGLTPMSSPRSYASAAALDGHIFAFGGGDGMSWYNTVECYSSRNNEWTECPSLNRKKGSLAGICLNEKIYAIGGGDGNEAYSEVEMFDPYLGKWICSPSMLLSRFALAATELNGVIYTSGGYDGSVYLEYAMGGYDGDKMVSSIEIFDPRLNTWRMGDPMNIPRGYAAAVNLDDNLFLIGGMQSNVQILDTVEVYNASTGWSVLGFNSIGKRSFASAVVL